MKAKTCLALAIAAGCATVASANPEKQILNNQVALPTGIIGHVYYNVATGELIKTTAGQRNASNPIWINEMYDECGFGEWFFSPIRDSATGEDTYWLDWGDIAENSVIDCFTMLYATDVSDPEEDGEVGFEVDLSFFDGIDWCCNIDSGLAPYLVWNITGIPGSASGIAAWLITIDFATAGTPENFFEVGDSDGIDASGNGLNSGGLGVDTDGLGNGSDFAYGYNFRHPASLTSGITGCGLVAPPEGVEPNSLGTEDVMALFLGDWSLLNGFFWFGGYDCSGGSGFLWTPWGDYYLGLYGGGGGPVCEADRNGDGVLDFFDVQDFLADFAAHDPSADTNNDGAFDFFDVQVFLQLFSAGCP